MCPSYPDTVRSDIDCIYLRSQLVSHGVPMDVDVWIVGSVAEDEKSLEDVNDIDVLVDANAGFSEVLPEKGFTLDVRVKDGDSVIVPVHFLHGFPTEGRVTIEL